MGGQDPDTGVGPFKLSLDDLVEFARLGWQEPLGEEDTRRTILAWLRSRENPYGLTDADIADTNTMMRDVLADAEADTDHWLTLGEITLAMRRVDTDESEEIDNARLFDELSQIIRERSLAPGETGAPRHDL
jgi:hypothetical protein